ncbi:hypothetical protein B9479_008115 [Cryptococcus floricola]|uniref:Uncharacterized protein n=1 Tax=Cryptococcus floricola TaxID=2591691 RepID=A0A5D3AKY8_9TREE|nr:hypothetical protein B9479_008115 [Cryptococcus floricola]
MSPSIHSGSPTTVTTGSMPTNTVNSSVPVTGPISGNPANTQPSIHSGPPAAPASGHTPENSADSSVPAPGSTSSSAASHRTVLAHPHTPATPAAPSLNPTTTHPSMTAVKGTDLALAASPLVHVRERLGLVEGEGGGVQQKILPKAHLQW